MKTGKIIEWTFLIACNLAFWFLWLGTDRMKNPYEYPPLMIGAALGIVAFQLIKKLTVMISTKISNQHTQ